MEALTSPAQPQETKLAVTVCASLMMMVVEGLVASVTFPVQSMNEKPGFPVAVKTVTEPSGSFVTPAGGVVFPAAGGEITTVSGSVCSMPAEMTHGMPKKFWHNS